MSNQTDVPAKNAILVVDDEEAICDITEKFLESLNIACIIAMDGDEGIEVFRRRHKEIGAVILDYTMPKLSGDQVFMAMRRINPKFP